MANNSGDDLQIVVGGDISPLEDALSQIGPAAQAAASSITSAFSSALNPIQNVESSLDFMSRTLAENAAAAQKAADGITQLGSAATGAAPSLTQVAQGMGGGAQAASEMEVNLQQLGRGIQSAGLLFSVLSVAVEQLGQNALETAATFERWQTAFTTMTGTLSEGAAMMHTVVSAAEETGVAVGTAAESIRNLMVHGFDPEVAVQAFHTIADAAAALGGGDGMINKLTTAFDVLATRGEVSVGGLTRAMNALQVSGVQGWQILAQSAGVSVTEMVAATKAGFVNAQDAMQVILHGMNSQFGGAAEKWSHSLAGVWNTFETETKVALAAIGAAIAPSAEALLAGLTPLLKIITDLANSFAKLPEPVKDVAFAVGAATVVFGPLLVAAGQAILMLGRLSAAFTTVAVEAPLAGAAVAESETAMSAAGGASGGASLLAGTLGTLGKAAAVAAAAFVGWELGKWAYDQVPGVKAFGDALGDLIAKMFGVGSPTTDATAKLSALRQEMEAMSHEDLAARLEVYQTKARQMGLSFDELEIAVKHSDDSIKSHIETLIQAIAKAGGFNDATRASEIALNISKGAADKYTQAMKDAQAAVVAARGALEELKSRQDSSAAGQAALVVAQNKLNDAIAAANPVIKGQGKALADATVYYSDTGAALDKFSGIMKGVPQTAAAMQDAIVKGFDSSKAINSLRDLSIQLTNMGADADAELGSTERGLAGLRDMVDKVRKGTIDMVLAMDPSKIQSFVQNGVEVLKGSLNTAGESTKQLAQNIATNMNIPLASAENVIKNFVAAQKEAVTSNTGFTKTLKDVPQAAEEATKQVVGLETGIGGLYGKGMELVVNMKDVNLQLGNASKGADAAAGPIVILTGKTNDLAAAAKNAAGGLTSMQQAQALINSTWQIGADNAGRIALGVAQLDHAQADAINNAVIAKGVYDDINDRYLKGTASIQQLQVAIENWVGAERKAVDPTGKLGGSISAISAAAQKAGGDLAKSAQGIDSVGNSAAAASKKVSALGDNLSTFASEGMSGMDKATMGAQAYLTMLNDMGASLADLTNAAAAFGYTMQTGYKSFATPQDFYKGLLAIPGYSLSPSGVPEYTYSGGGGSKTPPPGYHYNDQGQLLLGAAAGSAGSSGGSSVNTSGVNQALSSVATAASGAAAALSTTTTAAQGWQQVWQSTYNEFIALGNSVAMATQQANDAVSAMNKANGVFSTLRTSGSTAASALDSVATAAAGLSDSTTTTADNIGALGLSADEIAASQTSSFNSVFNSLTKLGFDFTDASNAAKQLAFNIGATAGDFNNFGGALQAATDATKVTMGDLLRLGYSFADASNMFNQFSGGSGTGGDFQNSSGFTQAASTASDFSNILSSLLASGMNFTDAAAIAGEMAKTGSNASADFAGSGGGIFMPPIAATPGGPAVIGPYDSLQTSLTQGAFDSTNRQNQTPIHITGNTFIGVPSQQVVASLGDAIMTYMTNKMRQQSRSTVA